MKKVLIIAALAATSICSAQKINYMGFRDCSKSAWNLVGTYPFQKWTNILGHKGWDLDILGFTGVSQGADGTADAVFGGAGGVFWRFSDQVRVFTGVSATGAAKELSQWKLGIALGFEISTGPAPTVNAEKVYIK